VSGGTQSAPRQRLEYLDALRGIAALTVMAYHFAYSVQPPELRAALLSATEVHFDLGRFGVVLFFLISGYVIPLSLSGEGALPRFAIGRLFRLYPAYWFAIAVMIGTALILGRALPSLPQLVANLTMAPRLLGAAPMANIFWTLLVELIFYGLCAGLYLTGLLRNTKAIFAACIATLAASAVPMQLGLPVIDIPYHLSFLFMGYLLRLSVLEGQREVGTYATASIALGIALAPLFQFSEVRDIANQATAAGLTLSYAAAVAVFAAVVVWKPAARSHVVLRAGAWSYSLYLLHVPIGGLVKAVVKPDDAVSSVVFFVVASVVALAVSAAAYRWIEEPAIAAGKRIAGRRRVTQDMEVAP
jgi:peptidoglycan/LPS O-acetylase OafA/YrhL